MEITVTDLPGTAVSWEMTVTRLMDPDGTEYTGDGVTDSGPITGGTQTLNFADLTIGNYEIEGHLRIREAIEGTVEFHYMDFDIPSISLGMVNVMSWPAFGGVIRP